MSDEHPDEAGGIDLPDEEEEVDDPFTESIFDVVEVAYDLMQSVGLDYRLLFVPSEGKFYVVNREDEILAKVVRTDKRGNINITMYHRPDGSSERVRASSHARSIPNVLRSLVHHLTELRINKSINDNFSEESQDK